MVAVENASAKSMVSTKASKWIVVRLGGLNQEKCTFPIKTSKKQRCRISRDVYGASIFGSKSNQEIGDVSASWDFVAAFSLYILY